MALDDVVTDVEPEAGAAGLGGGELLEQRVHVLRRNAGSMIPELRDHGWTGPSGEPAAAGADRHVQTGARRGCLRRVLDQIDEYLLDLIGVVRHRRRERCDL